MKNINKILIVFLACLASCTADSDSLKMQTGETIGKKINIIVPGHSRPATYAAGIDVINENYIKELDVLIFREDPFGDELFDYAIQLNIADIKDVTASGDKKMAVINLKPTDPGEPIRIVVLANCRSFLPASIAQGAEKNALLNSIEYSIANKAWPADSGSSFEPFYMWGESSLLELDPNRDVPTIQLLRSVSKIEFGLNFVRDTPQGLDNFKLEEVFIFNVNTKGYLVPLPVNYSETKQRVTAPSIPSSPDKQVLPISYTSDDNIGIRNQIYIAEADAMTTSTKTTSTYAIIKGQYKREDGTWVTSYYRIDFVKGNGVNKSYIPVLRNHIYRFNIGDISREGQSSLNDASNSHAINDYIHYDLDIIDESVSTDGENLLTLSKERVDIIYYTAQTETIEVESTTSWTATPEEPWVTVSPSSGVANVRETFTINVQPTSGPRECAILFESGNIKKKLIVSQKYCDVVPANYNGRNNVEIEVFIRDQEPGYTWHEYANVPDGYNSEQEPPFPRHMQVYPPRPASCAALDAGGHNDWRMPSIREMLAISDYVIDNNWTKIFINDFDLPFYKNWIAYFSYFSSSATNPDWGKINTGTWMQDYKGKPISAFVQRAYPYIPMSVNIVTQDYGNTFFSSDVYSYYVSMYDIKGKPFTISSALQDMGIGIYISEYKDYYNELGKGKISSGVRCVRGDNGFNNRTHKIDKNDTGLGYDLYLAPWDQVDSHSYITEYGEVINYYWNKIMNRVDDDYADLQEHLNPAHPLSCEAYNAYSYGGLNDWRVPSIAELKAIFAYCNSSDKLLDFGFYDYYSNNAGWTPKDRAYLSSDIVIKDGANIVKSMIMSVNTFYEQEESMDYNPGYSYRPHVTRCVAGN